MIINDDFRFAFIHIPKCAGTSVRRPLEKFDSLHGLFSDRVDNCPALGQLDYVHIPLFTLREHFPREFKAVQEYWSFAVMRDPFSRFASSVSQRLKMYSDQPIQKRSFDEIRRVIDESIDFLGGQPAKGRLLPPEYIHFQKQVDYIQLNGVCIVDKIYLLDEVEILLADLGRIVGQDLLARPARGAQATHANRTVVFRSDLLRRVIEAARPVTNQLSKVLPDSTKQRIRQRVYVPRDQGMEEMFEAEDVRAFITDYYARDLELYQQITDQAKRAKS